MYKVIKGPEINKKAIKLGIFGDSGVGKTCICESFLGLEYKEGILQTIGLDKMRKKIKLNNGNDTNVIIWDTAGGDRFRDSTLKILRFMHGGIIVFDVASKKSFENLSVWLDAIKQEYPNFYVIIFGNKTDKDKSEWKVTNEEINKFIDEKKLIYFEISAKNAKGINEGFISYFIIKAIN